MTKGPALPVPAASMQVRFALGAGKARSRPETPTWPYKEIRHREAPQKHLGQRPFGPEAKVSSASRACGRVAFHRLDALPWQEPFISEDVSMRVGVSAASQSYGTKSV